MLSVSVPTLTVIADSLSFYDQRGKARVLSQRTLRGSAPESSEGNPLAWGFHDRDDPSANQ